MRRSATGPLALHGVTAVTNKRAVQLSLSSVLILTLQRADADRRVFLFGAQGS